MKTKDLDTTIKLLHRRYNAYVPEADLSPFMRLVSIGDMSDWQDHELNAFVRVARERGDVLGCAAKGR